MSKLTIYAAGGAALNVTSEMGKYIGNKEYGYAEIEAYYIDTSSSNIHSEIDSEKIYLVEGLDGSGKVRKSNYKALLECSKDILHQFKPSDINIVVHSLSGGTGSTLGPIIVSELLSRGKNVVVLAIGSSNSRIEAENTLKTLKSYEMIANKKGNPVCMFYRENGVATPRSHVDTNISTAIVLLATLFSSDNKELDLSDLTNFINYNNVTSYPPQLALLEFHESNIESVRGQTIITVATLTSSDTNSELGESVEYQCVGYMPDKVKSDIGMDIPIHYTINAGYFNKIVESLESTLEVYDEARTVVISKSILNDNDEGTQEGLIL